MTRKPAIVERQLVLEARRRAQEAEERRPRTASAAELKKVDSIAARRTKVPRLPSRRHCLSMLLNLKRDGKYELAREIAARWSKDSHPGPRMLSPSEQEQLRQETKRDAAMLRAEFAKRKKPRV